MFGKKQIIFDIDTKVAKQILGKNYTSIYNKIRYFFKSNGFEHIEGSGYMSNYSLDYYDVIDIIDRMKIEFPYIEKCVRDIRVTEITKQHSLNHMLDYDGTPGKYAQDTNASHSEIDDYYDDFEM